MPLVAFLSPQMRTTKGSYALQDAASANYLANTYPNFSRLLSINIELAKRIQESSDPYTIFVPNPAAFAKLDNGVLSKMRDPRNKFNPNPNPNPDAYSCPNPNPNPNPIVKLLRK